MTIRLRLSLGMAALVVAAFGVLVWQMLGEIRPRLLEAMEDALVETANYIAASVESGATLDATMARLKDRKIGASIFGARKDASELRVLVTDDKGIVRFDSEKKDAGKDFSQWHDIAMTLKGKYGARSSRSNPNDPASSVKYISAPVRRGSAVVGAVTVAMPSTSIGKYLINARRKVIATGIVVALVAIVLAGLFSLWLTTPINALMSYARAVTAGDRALLPTTNVTELRELGHAFQSMREALEGKKYVENYTQTLTHELKSPLAGIRAAAEILNEDPPEQDRRKFLGNILTQTERVTELIDRMLLLSSLERQDTLAKGEECDLKELVNEVVDTASAKLVGKRLAVDSHFEPAKVKGDKFLLRQAVSNLLDNAIDFAPEGSRLNLSVTTQELSAEIRIEDGGPGIPAASLDRIFERFYSLPRPATGKRSSGIGLNLVREVATLHSGDIRLENRKEGGARAVLRLPL